ncbi:DUF371 domain-containing protein [Candidatus Woesearchaeota archaeon]|nr:DUF371 domain-containing protein [Candidatus Woesearchaeota archaeon]
MDYSFSAKGHKNILATHASTIEFTKDSELTLEGDCIAAVEADFSLEELQKFLKYGKIRVIIEAGSEKEEITAVPNPSFSSSKEMVIRKSDFTSERTFAIRANRAASDLGRGLADALKKGADVSIKITTLQ